MAEALVLEASVLDKFSKPLRDLRDRLREVKAPDNIGRMGDDFGKIDKAVLRASTSIRDGLGGALKGLGIHGLAAVGGISGVTAAVAKFSSSAIHMDAFVRSTGFAELTLKSLRLAASQFGVTADEIEPALKKLSESITAVEQHRLGSVFDTLQQPNIREVTPGLIETLEDKKLSKEEKLEVVERNIAKLKALGTDNAREAAQILSEQLTGSDALFRLTLRGYEALAAAQARAAKHVHENTAAETENAIAAAEAIETLRESFDKLSDKVANKFSPAITDGMNRLTKFVEESKDAESTLRGLKELLGGIDTATETNFPGAIEEAKRLYKSHAPTWLGGDPVAEEKDKKAIEEGTEKGTLGAFNKLFQRQSFKGGGGVGGGGIINASYGGASVGGGGSAQAAVAGGAAVGGGGRGPAQPAIDGIRNSAVIPGAAVAGGGDPVMLDHIDRVAGNNPELKRKLLSIYAGESKHIPGHYDVGDKGTSFGPLQFHRGGEGSIGGDFERETGLNLEDPKTIPQQFDYGASWLKKHPKADPGETWHGYRDRGKRMVDAGWGAKGDTASSAMSMLGKHEIANKSDIEEYLRTGGHGMDPSKAAWCAAFVGASLNKAGHDSLTSNVATDYLNYGKSVKDGVKRGDIAVFARGRRPGQIGGHIGIATGRTRDGQIETVEGNTADRVGTRWHSEGSTTLRRPDDVGSLLAAQDARKANAAQKSILEGRASLDVHIRHDGKISTKTNGGTLFRDMPITRGRSMVPAGEDV